MNAEAGWIAGQPASTIRRTADGGRTWEQRPTGLRASDTITDLRFLDARVGYALARGKVIATRDGGQTWQLVGSDLATGARAIHFPDSRNGWVVGDDGYIARYQPAPQ